MPVFYVSQNAIEHFINLTNYQQMTDNTDEEHLDNPTNTHQMQDLLLKPVNFFQDGSKLYCTLNLVLTSVSHLMKNITASRQ